MQKSQEGEKLVSNDPFNSGQISHWAHCIISSANVCWDKTLSEAARDIEEQAKNGYYDDQEGCELMMKIAQYLRLRAQENSGGFSGV